ncbi:hypothetical protein wHma_08090 [Wolbachia pipientis]|nr:hypothetical protein wHma_08090 [Wolbachia pipientis]
MNNKNKSKDRRKEIEFRALNSGGKALRDDEIMETLLSSVHQAQAITKNLGLVDIKNSDIEYSLLIGKENAI